MEEEIKVWKAHISFKGLLETQGLETDRIKRIIEEISGMNWPAWMKLKN